MKKDTSKLDEILNSGKRDMLAGFFKENEGDMLSPALSSGTFIRDLAKKNGLKLDEAYMRAGMSASYGRKISSGKNVQKRDTIIRLAVALHADLTEANRLLKLYGLRALYPRDKRDAVLIVAFNEGLSDTNDVDSLLAEYSLAPLEKCSRDEE